MKRNPAYGKAEYPVFEVHTLMGGKFLDPPLMWRGTALFGPKTCRCVWPAQHGFDGWSARAYAADGSTLHYSEAEAWWSHVRRCYELTLTEYTNLGEAVQRGKTAIGLAMEHLDQAIRLARGIAPLTQEKTDG